MSDRRAVSAGHAVAAARAGASSVAAGHEAWRVAVGGNRVESMTVEQIAHAFHSGQLNARTPLWPPGATGWQALGNFAEFQAPPSAYQSPSLAQFVEADDDPTRMWTGGADLASMEAAMQAPHGRPPAQTGVRQVVAPRPPAASAPRAAAFSQPGFSQPTHAQPAAYAMPAPPPVPSRPAPMPSRPAPTASVASSASHQPALVPSSIPPFRSKSRGNGLMLAAGLVGLVGLGSAVLAARGSWGSSAQRANEEVAVAAEAPAARAAEPAAPAPEAPAAGEAQLAKYEDTSALAGEAAKPAAKEAASEEAKPAEVAKLDESKSDDAKADDAKADAAKTKSSDDADEKEAADSSAKSERVSKVARTRSEEPSSKKVSSREKKRAAALAAAERRKPAPRAAKMIEKPEKAEPVEKAEKPEKVEKVEKAEKAAASEPQQGPANAAVNEAAAAALANSANLASSCRPRGGPSGPGKARVIYSNDGEVQSVEILTAKFRDTLTGSCVRMVFRRAKIAPFKGEPPTFIKSFTIPEE